MDWRTRSLVAVAGALTAVGLVAADARADGSISGPEWEIRSNGAVVGMGDAENRLDGTAAVWCTGTNWQKSSRSRPYFFTRSGDYTKDVAIYRETTDSKGEPKRELFATLRPSGRLEYPNKQLRAIVQQEVLAAGTTTKVTFRDEFGSLQGYAYWSPRSAGFYDARDRLVGTFGTKIDRDMRMLAFFYFFVYPQFC